MNKHPTHHSISSSIRKSKFDIISLLWETWKSAVFCQFKNSIDSKKMQINFLNKQNKSGHIQMKLKTMKKKNVSIQLLRFSHTNTPSQLTLSFMQQTFSHSLEWDEILNAKINDKTINNNKQFTPNYKVKEKENLKLPPMAWPK